MENVRVDINGTVYPGEVNTNVLIDKKFVNVWVKFSDCQLIAGLWNVDTAKRIIAENKIFKV